MEIAIFTSIPINMKNIFTIQPGIAFWEGGDCNCRDYSTITLISDEFQKLSLLWRSLNSEKYNLIWRSSGYPFEGGQTQILKQKREFQKWLSDTSYSSCDENGIYMSVDIFLDDHLRLDGSVTNYRYNLVFSDKTKELTPKSLWALFKLMAEGVQSDKLCEVLSQSDAYSVSRFFNCEGYYVFEIIDNQKNINSYKSLITESKFEEIEVSDLHSVLV